MASKYILRRLFIGAVVILLIASMAFVANRYSLTSVVKAVDLLGDDAHPKLNNVVKLKSDEVLNTKVVSLNVPVITKVEFKLINESTYYLHGNLVNGLSEAVQWPLIEVSLLTNKVVIAKQIISTEQYLAGNRLQGLKSPLNIPPKGSVVVSSNIHFSGISVKPEDFMVRVFYQK